MAARALKIFPDAIIIASCLLTLLAVLRQGGAGGLLPGAFIQASTTPPPVPADLDGDGRAELIVPGPGPQVAVYGARALEPVDGWPQAMPSRTVSLLPQGVRVSAGREPVALAAGCISGEGRRCKNAVVAVTEGLHVIAMDSNLRRMWERPLMEHLAPGVRAKEAAAMVTHHPAKEGDEGLVIIGARAGGKSDAGAMDKSQESLLEDSERIEEAFEGESESWQTFQGGAGADLRKFTMVALAGSTGQERWRREIFPENSFEQQEQPSDEQWALHSQYGPRPGPNLHTCKSYRESLMAAVPHHWRRSRDTAIKLAHFAHQRRKKPRGHANAESASKDGLQSSQRRKGTHGRTWQRLHPNVAVAHVREGLEAIELHTGRAVCGLPLPSDQLHVDLDGDGALDHVTSSGDSCSLQATTGIPATEESFQAYACSSSRRARAGVSLAPPSVVPMAPRSAEKVKHHLFALNSHGEVTCFTPDGRVKWRSRTGSRWASLDPSFAGWPSLVPLSLRARFGGPEAVVATGDSQVTVLSLSGREISNAKLPDTAVATPVIVDLEADGHVDAFVPCTGGIFSLHQRSSASPLPFALVLALLAAGTAMLIAHRQGEHFSHPRKQQAWSL